MTIERTLSIIKPDAVRRNIIGNINAYIESAGLRIIAQKMVLLKPEQVNELYIIHKDRPFFNDIIAHMSSGAVVLQVLECDDAVMIYRDVMGATNPKDAKRGTIRGDLALSLSENSVHGSDTVKNADTEISLCFAPSEIVR